MEKNSLMFTWRLSSFLYKNHCKVIARLIYRFIRLWFQCEIPPSVIIGKGTLFIHNGLGCVVHPRTAIGSNCRIYQNVTIGGRNGRGTPIIKDNVFIGPGACILGGVEISSDACIGANAVVLSSVREGITVVGIPAKEI